MQGSSIRAARRILGTAAVLSAAFIVSDARAGFVGQPTGTFGITIQQGSTIIVDNPSVTVPADIFIDDGDPEDFVQIGSTVPNGGPIILKIVSEGDSQFRILHFYIDVPISLGDIHSPGPDSLIDPTNPFGVDVTISNLSFTNSPYVYPLLVNNSTFAVTFQRDDNGLFYNLNDGIATGTGPSRQVQVYGTSFFDSNPENSFAFVDGPTMTFSWLGLQNPGYTGATVNDGDDSIPDVVGSGYVFELGLGLAVVPEPGTLGLLAAGIALCFGPRRRRRS